MELCPQCGAEPDDNGLCGMCLPGGALQTEPTIAATPATQAMTEGMPGGSQSALEYDDFDSSQIQRVLGQDGMGTVCLAQQIAPLHNMVAPKVVDKTELKGLRNFDMKWLRSAATQGTGDEVKSSYSNRRTQTIGKQD